MNESTEFNEKIFENTGKYNMSVKLTEEDQKNNVKIYCKEPYAQQLYDAMVAFEKSQNITSFSKDLIEGQIYLVKANTISYNDKMIHAEEVNSKCNISVPFREYSKSLDSLATGEEAREFYVTLYRVNSDGEYLGSERKAKSVTYRQELFRHLAESTWFDVKILKLIKGGYLASYHDEIECFIPGSHAAANVLHNFNNLLGKTLTVMVDNYDSANDLFILSYKKYIANSMPLMITELKFDHEYTGVLTTAPYDFGVFVEIDSYYTGLIHKSEFENYEEIRKKMKTGDTINVYVKDVTSKNNQYRIVLTLSQSQVNSEKLHWQELRNRTENQSFRYSVNKNKSSISIDIDGENFEVSLKRSDLEKNLSSYPYVKVFKVDPINKRLKFEFVDLDEG